MLTQEEFASLLLIGHAPSTYGTLAVIPPEHSARLIALVWIVRNGRSVD